MKCQNCGSNRILFISGKTNDMCYSQYKEWEYDGYVPDDISLEYNDGDYLEINFCLECCQIQGDWPAVEPYLEK